MLKTLNFVENMTEIQQILGQVLLTLAEGLWLELSSVSESPGPRPCLKHGIVGLDVWHPHCRRKSEHDLCCSRLATVFEVAGLQSSEK
jgi:hypothetical protein